MSFNTTHRSAPPTTIHLCDPCSAVPFNADDPPFGDARGPYRWSLGTLDRIRSTTHCPLCRLVVLAVYDGYHGHSWLPDGEIVLQWRNSGGGSLELVGLRLGVSIRFVKDPSFRGRQLHSCIPVTDSQLDVSRARSWVSACESNHKETCNSGRGPAFRSFDTFLPGLDVLRLIDVVKGRLVELREPCRYVTLSYVWGGVNNVRLTSSNRATLMKDGVLRTIWDLLPRTIQDAIDIVKALEERFLWIDALCLVQNDAADMYNGIGVMDLIYERAALCVIAASGDNADAGLPGVRGGCRLVTSRVEQIRPGIKLAVYNDLDHVLRSSAYNRRGWTFQESYLSRRALYFTDDQVYFRCRESTWSENWVDRLPEPNNDEFDATLLPIAWKVDPESEYRLILLYYTLRGLTNQADALLAMAGIIRRLSIKMRCRFFQGMPVAAFDTFMIFVGYNSLLRRRRGFPSYSWAGWIGQVSHYEPNQENTWLCDRTWIVWYKRSSSGSVNLVWDIMANEAFPTGDMDFLGYRKRSLFQNKHELRFSTSRTTPTNEQIFEREFPPYPILQFWTLAVYFTIANFQVFKALGCIYDRFGAVCGQVEMDGFEETDFFETSGSLEFIVLSEARRENGDSTNMTDWDQGLLNYSNNPHPWAYYTVLLLEWEGGIAERRGIGTIYQKAVERSCEPGPLWKEIFLA